jgi:hypothetical protein
MRRYVNLETAARIAGMKQLGRRSCKFGRMTKSHPMSPRMHMFLAIKEKRFAKRVTKRLLKSHSAVSAENPGLSGKALYREVLLHKQQVDPSRVDQILREAEESVDDWADRAEQGLEFRQVVHVIVLSQYRAAGYEGTVVSFRDIVYSLIPADL